MDSEARHIEAKHRLLALQLKQLEQRAFERANTIQALYAQRGKASQNFAAVKARIVQLGKLARPEIALRLAGETMGAAQIEKRRLRAIAAELNAALGEREAALLELLSAKGRNDQCMALCRRFSSRNRLRKEAKDVEAVAEMYSSAAVAKARPGSRPANKVRFWRDNKNGPGEPTSADMPGLEVRRDGAAALTVSATLDASAQTPGWGHNQGSASPFQPPLYESRSACPTMAPVHAWSICWEIDQRIEQLRSWQLSGERGLEFMCTDLSGRPVQVRLSRLENGLIRLRLVAMRKVDTLRLCLEESQIRKALTEAGFELEASPGLIRGLTKAGAREADNG